MDAKELLEKYKSGERYFFNANLREADLREADLSRAELSRATLIGATLSREQIENANMQNIAYDILFAVDNVHQDIPFLVNALKTGKVDGRFYRNNCDVGCLAGTIEMAHHIPDGECLPEFPRDSNSPRERWFTGIKKGDTPETNAISAWTVELLEKRMAFYREIALAWSQQKEEGE